MADTDSLIHPTKPQQNQPPKFLSNFLYKVIFISILIALLPLFPSQSPEFPNQTILTHTWELLQLLLVGIAISYGLFSRRNSDPDTEKEPFAKPSDTPQSYVSQILQVSSVFDEDNEDETPHTYDNKIETWNSQCYPGEPVAMVAKESVANGDNGTTKPLFLPVRSLKACSQDMEDMDFGEVVDGPLPELEEIGEIRRKESAVLPSPIPWRSRSGRMEVKEESSLRSMSMTPLISQEIRGKTSEDLGKKKSFKPSPSPPPPPPPPPPIGHGCNFVSEKRNVKKSFKDELKDLSQRGQEGYLDSLSSDYTSLAATAGKSVRTIRPMDTRNQTEKKNEFIEKVVIASESDNDSDSDDEDTDFSSDEEVAAKSVETPEENEVDKKAGEFIAKFREQIRLQRIESIKRTSGQRRSIRSSK